MKSYMRSGSRFSSPFTPNIGVPQGDVIAAILFALFIADLPKSLLPVGPEIEINLVTCMIAYILFADDLALLADSPENLQKQLIALQNYCELNNLKVNIIKTKVMIFHRGRLPNLDINFTFRFNNIPIERVNSFTYLGFTFTATLSFSLHIDKIVSKARSRIGLISHKVNLKELNLELVLQLFALYIVPIFRYGLPIWLSNHSNSAAASINSMLTKFLRCT